MRCYCRIFNGNYTAGNTKFCHNDLSLLVSLTCFTFQKMVVFILTAVRYSNLTTEQSVYN